MKKWSKHSILVFIIGSFFITQICYAQQDVESLLKKANKQIHENPNLAINLAEKAYKMPEITLRNKINCLLAISTAYSSKRDYEKSSEYVERIKDLLPKIDDAKQKMNILNRIAGHYQELQIYEKALEYLDESLTLIEMYPKQDSVQTYLGYNSTLRGFIYREQMNCEIALTYFNQAISAYQKTLYKPVMNANLSICYYNKGNCLISLGKIEEAKRNFQKAIDHAERLKANSLIAFGQKGLAQAKTFEGNYKEAIGLLKNALQISENVGDLILNKGLYEGLSNNYLALHDWNNYSLFHNKFIKVKTETKNSERKMVNRSLLNLTQAKSAEIEKLNKSYTPLQICLTISIAIGLFLLTRFIILAEIKLNKIRKILKK